MFRHLSHLSRRLRGRTWADLPLRAKGLVVVAIPLLATVLFALTQDRRARTLAIGAIGLSVLLGIAGGIAAVLLFTSGVTRRAARLEALLEHIVAWSPMVMFRGLLGGQGERYISGNVERLLGYTPEQVLGTPGFWVEQLHPEDRDRFTAKLERAVAERVPQLEQEYRFLLPDGYRWLYGVTRLVYDDDGALADTLSYASTSPSAGKPPTPSGSGRRPSGP